MSRQQSKSRRNNPKTSFKRHKLKRNNNDGFVVMRPVDFESKNKLFPKSLKNEAVDKPHITVVSRQLASAIIQASGFSNKELYESLAYIVETLPDEYSGRAERVSLLGNSGLSLGRKSFVCVTPDQELGKDMVNERTEIQDAMNIHPIEPYTNDDIHITTHKSLDVFRAHEIQDKLKTNLRDQECIIRLGEAVIRRSTI